MQLICGQLCVDGAVCGRGEDFKRTALVDSGDDDKVEYSVYRMLNCSDDVKGDGGLVVFSY